MVEPIQRLEPVETYFTPRCVAHWLENWRELMELAEPTPGAIRYDRLSAHVPVPFQRADPMRYAAAMADLERALIHFHIVSKEFMLAQKTIDGHSLKAIADWLQTDLPVAEREFMQVCRTVATRLGWKER